MSSWLSWDFVSVIECWLQSAAWHAVGLAEAEGVGQVRGLELELVPLHDDVWSHGLYSP